MANAPITISANTNKPNEKKLDIILPPDKDPNKYKVAKKEIPQSLIDLKLKYKNKEIIWFNNFGVQVKGTFPAKGNPQKTLTDPFIDEAEGQEFEYTVEVSETPPSDDYKSVVWYDGSNVVFGASKDGNGKFRFNLKKGDPPTGWGGG